MFTPLNLSIAAGLFVAFVALMLAFAWRTVVSTNVVHIVQSRKRTTSYGANLEAGNVYYAIPHYIPFFGLSRIELPVNNFALDLNDYKAYDKDRVPFVIHVTAFFRVADTNVAAARVHSFEELQKQLEQVVKGAVRKILASHEIHVIMTGRATFGQQFTDEVATELQNWGVVPVKNMELMDIRDAEDSKVISNIMAQKSSHIEMESRTIVASNHQKAKTAEIEANRTVELSGIEAKRTTELAVMEANQAIGERHAEQEKAVGIAKAEQAKAVGVANEKAAQETKAQAVVTKQREMEIVSVQTQRQAEIQRAAAVVGAEQEKSVTMTVAQGNLERTKLEATGVELTGTAKAAAEKAMQLAPIQAQIELAKEIGENQGYQTYLVTLRRVEMEQAVGIAQADALKAADIRVIANTGTAPQGISSIGELMSSKGGQQLGAAIESLKNTSETAAKVLGNGGARA